MKLVILNQAKNHHKYLIKNIAENFEVTAIITELESLKPSFKTHHSFEDEQDIYEKESLLNNTNINLNDISQTFESKNINDNIVLSTITKLNPDIILTVGTGLIKSSLINLCPDGFINLHGGDPQYYRGLDSFLWAIYHKEFSKLVVTLHMLNKKLDDGEIIQQGQIKPQKNLKIYQLRSENIKICLKLVISSLSLYDLLGEFVSNPQTKKGRYYSFMPSVLKQVCVKNFNNYINSI